MTKTEDNKLRSSALPLNRRVQTVGPSRNGKFPPLTRYVRGVEVGR